MKTALPLNTAAYQAARSHAHTSRFDYRDNLLWIDGSCDTASETLHELVHFFEFSSTPYGWFCAELNDLSLSLINRMLERWAGDVPTPLYDIVRHAQELISDEGNLALISQFIRPWSKLMYLLQAFEGDAIDIDDAQSILSETLTWMEDACRVAQLDLGSLAKIEDSALVGPQKNGFVERTEFEISPSVPWKENEESETSFKTIGARHVSETLAQLYEGVESAWGSKFELDYTILFYECIIRRGLLDLKFTNELDHLVIPSTCVALCDLAMFTPIGSVFSSLRTPDLCWEDIHPGHRFLRALAIVSQHDLWIGPHECPKEMGESVCQQLNWPCPERFVELGAKFPDRHREQHRDSFRLRQQDFSLFYLVNDKGAGGGLNQIRKFIDDYLPITKYPGKTVVCGFSERRQSYASPFHYFRDCLMNRLHRQLMCGHVLAFDLLPHELQLSNYFEDISSPKDLAEAISEVCPWMTLGRFRSRL